MPKTSKTQPKKQLKTKNKVQSKPVSITSRKSYWIFLTIAMVLFGVFFGYSENVAVAAIGIMLASVLAVIAFAWYLKFKPSPLKATLRATFIFVGASVIGFLIWVVMILIIGATKVQPQIANSIGDGFFIVTSFIICLISGGFIGDLIGKNKEAIQLFLHNIRNRIFGLGTED